MTRLAVIALLAAAAIATAALASIASDKHRRADRPTRAAPRTKGGEPTPTPQPPAIPIRALNRQDRTDRRQRHAESAAHDRRPLLTQLPLTRAGVTIDLAGLDSDGRRALLSIRHPRSSRRHAQAVYRRALRTAHDTSHAYRAHYQP